MAKEKMSAARKDDLAHLSMKYVRGNALADLRKIEIIAKRLLRIIERKLKATT